MNKITSYECQAVKTKSDGWIEKQITLLLESTTSPNFSHATSDRALQLCHGNFTNKQTSQRY